MIAAVIAHPMIAFFGAFMALTDALCTSSSCAECVHTAVRASSSDSAKLSWTVAASAAKAYAAEFRLVNTLHIRGSANSKPSS